MVGDVVLGLGRGPVGVCGNRDCAGCAAGDAAGVVRDRETDGPVGGARKAAGPRGGERAAAVGGVATGSEIEGRWASRRASVVVVVVVVVATAASGICGDGTGEGRKEFGRGDDLREADGEVMLFTESRGGGDGRRCEE